MPCLNPRHTSQHQRYKVLQGIQPPVACATRKLPLRQAACSKVVPFRSRACGSAESLAVQLPQ